MKAIVVTDQAAGTAGMTVVERPEPQAAINDVVVQVYASGFVNTELGWPSTWTDRLGRDGTLAEYAAVEARNLAPLPGDVDFTVGASLPISGLTAWQGLMVHGRLQAGQRVIAHG